MYRRLFFTSFLCICIFVPAFADDSFITSESKCDNATLGSTEQANLVARWTPNTYAVTYLCGSGVDGTPPVVDTATYDATYTFANSGSCAKTGYTFQGWSCPDIDNLIHTAESTYKWLLTKGVTCTAVFNANTINVNWHPENGNPSTSNTCTYDGSITLPAQPEKTGYTFKGWKVVQDSSE